MKKLILFSAAISSVAIAAPAMAQESTGLLGPITGYGTLGYGVRKHGDQMESVTGRLGLRMGRFVGIEGEGAFGVDDKKGSIGGVPYKSELDRSVAAYAVGYLPVTQRLDLFGRVGLGNTKMTGTLGNTELTSRRDSVNYGGGAQFFFTGHDGLRADFTRESYRNGPGHANVWGVSYVRKF